MTRRRTRIRNLRQHQQTPESLSDTAQETSVDDQPIGTEPSRYNLRQMRRLGYSTLTRNLDIVLDMSVTCTAVATAGGTAARVLQSTSQNRSTQSRQFPSSDIIISLSRSSNVSTFLINIGRLFSIYEMAHIQLEELEDVLGDLLGQLVRISRPNRTKVPIKAGRSGGKPSLGNR
ncbi:hypothetical protein RB195_022158 [Necator americanus]|uniref:Uncharacterized protein n=1 Tax=Necator americanus TaxID=51031 RepID=A0ABR1EGV9_NECAM